MGAVPDLLAVVNAAAGSADRPRVDAATTALRTAAGRVGADLEVVATTDLGHLARTLAGLAGRRLVVLGGDGSVRAAVQALHDDDALRGVGPVGIVPLGTGNDLARSLGLSAHPVRAAGTVVAGAPREMVLLVSDDGVVAVNAVHVGVGAAAGRNAAGLKRSLGRVGLGALAYPLGAAVAGLTERGWWVRVSVDGTAVHPADERLLMVALGLGETVGGGAPLVPGADPHEPAADVVVARAVGPLARLGYAAQLTTGAHVLRPDVVTARGRTVQLEAAPGGSFPTDVDGEVRGPFTAQRWDVRPAAWRVVVPG